MKRIVLITSLFLLSQCLAIAEDKDSLMISKIFNYALSHGECYQNLEYLSLNIGHRLSGSEGSEKAIHWTKELMESYGFDNVFLQEVMVPAWERGGKEKAVFKTSDNKTIHFNALALGNSIGTGSDGIEGEIIEVMEMSDLENIGREKIEGKIVFFNKPMDPGLINTGQAYSETAAIRYRGPAYAARYGALGVVVRSLTTRLDEVIHTGSTGYEQDVPQIPAIAISTLDSEKLSDLIKNESSPVFYFKTDCRILEDKLSYNVIGEIQGSEYPDEYIVVGGHLDSWDVGHGAHDDGAGCMHSIEVLRILKQLNYKPKRTLRVVLFTNEENGLRGGRAYAAVVDEKNENHIAAIESDSGGFSPLGFSMSGTEEAFELFSGWSALFRPYHVNEFYKGGGGADIGPLGKYGVPLIGFRPDNQRYFKYHHSTEDTFDKIDERELEMGAAAITSLVYLIDQYGLKK